MQTIFTENKQQENLLMPVMSRIIALLRDVTFLHICKMVLQNNRGFCAFVFLVKDIKLKQS